jgi:amidohydrolase
METPRQSAAQAAQRHLATAVALSEALHSDPELGLEEVRASGRVADLLEHHGFRVQRGVAGLPTALRAQTGSGDLHVGLVAEYDALPGLGHACGHNVIAATSVLAALALRDVAQDAGLSIVLLGTPAEETASGKVTMLQGGAFDDLHLAMMVHPAPFDAARIRTRAFSSHTVRFHGRAAHASATPELGRNAADALTIAQVAIGLLRQQLPARAQVHGVTGFAGDAAGVIPALVESEWFVRADDRAEHASVRERVLACFDAGALAAGCRAHVEQSSPTLPEMRADEELLALWSANAVALDRPGRSEAVDLGSTDMAAVSHHLPAIHPLVAIDTAGETWHTPGFARAAAGPSARAAILDGAIGLAWTALDAAASPPLRRRLLSRSVRPSP